MKMLSINVALLFVMQLGLVIAGNMLWSRKFSRNLLCVVGFLTDQDYGPFPGCIPYGLTQFLLCVRSLIYGQLMWLHLC